MIESSANQSFLEHLEELRYTIFRSLISIIICYIPSFFLVPYLIKQMVIYLFPLELGTLNYFAPLEVFMTQLKLSLVIALILSFPFNLWNIWSFLMPALYPNERKALKWWVLFATFLFVFGAIFCFVWILPLLIQFAFSFASDYVRPTIGINNFLVIIGQLLLAFGFMFQFPMFIILTIRFGIVKKTTLSAKRPYLIIIILILSAILTPPDIISQLLLAIPTYLLFELGLFLAKDKK